MSRHRNEPLLDAVIRFDNMPAEGRRLSVRATAEQREKLAEELNVSGIESLEADLVAMPFRGGVRVEGQLRARTVQPCVVTFEPVTQDIAEPIDRILLPGSEHADPRPTGTEVFVDLEGDLPDYVEGPEVDLTPLIAETVALALDPYPRASGARIEDMPDAKDEEPEASPFAALARLKDQG